MYIRILYIFSIAVLRGEIRLCRTLCISHVPSSDRRSSVGIKKKKEKKEKLGVKVIQV